MPNKTNFQSLMPRIVPVLCALLSSCPTATASSLEYSCSKPPLEAHFAVLDNHYNGAVNCGNLFLQSDIPVAPVIRWKKASAGKLYTLMMLDLDGNANGSFPDKVAPGENSPLRHWIVGNIPGQLLRSQGYIESQAATAKVHLLQAFRSPQIPMVSDRYGLYLFEQRNKIDFQELSGPITNYDYLNFIDTYKLGAPKASNYFVAVFTSKSPFSGKAFSGNDVSKTWHQGYGKGALPPVSP